MRPVPWPKLTLTVALIGAGALIFRLALARHIHVDEFHNVYSMQLVGSFGHPEYADPAELYHVLFAPLTRHFASTRAIFWTLRLIWASLFLGLLVAVAWIQPFFPTPWGRVLVFIGVASWWPSWRHGIEIRHDLLLALGVVALYREALQAERGSLSARAACIAGAVAAWMQLDSHKAVTLWGPALLSMCWLQVRCSRGAAWRALSWTCVGLCGGALSGFALLLSGGALGAYFAQLEHFRQYAAGADRFSALPLFQLLLETGSPLTASILVFAAVALGQAWRRRLPRFVGTTLAFLSFSLFAIAINPVPYPYNLVWMSPSLLLAGVAGAHYLLERVPRFRLPLAAVLLILAGSQFADELTRQEYTRRDWNAQLRLIDAAETLTAVTDPIFDGVGMVCTRPPATRDWLLHSVFMPEYRRGQREQVRDVIARAAPPVLIGGHYRFRWLSDADWSAISAHYVGVSPQLWVLGVSTTEAQQIEILRGGRYAVLPTAADAVTGVDGRDVLAGAVIELSSGAHRVSGATRLFWVGPTASELPTGLILGETLFAHPQLPGQ